MAYLDPIDEAASILNRLYHYPVSYLTIGESVLIERVQRGKSQRIRYKDLAELKKVEKKCKEKAKEQLQLSTAIEKLANKRKTT